MYQFENGDMNWIIPDKFLAFSNPSPAEFDKNGRRRCTIEEVIPRFKSLAIERVVRLNSEEYDADSFTQSGIAHTDLYFTDGTAPPEVCAYLSQPWIRPNQSNIFIPFLFVTLNYHQKDIVLKFLKVSENTPGRIAVHCKVTSILFIELNLIIIILHLLRRDLEELEPWSDAMPWSTTSSLLERSSDGFACVDLVRSMVLRMNSFL